ncbi:MAG: hypothetical protein FWC36_01410, partial [Spirochaetes bacterium]|nr:hypothetical protein [Spirochaetota bacterium]
QKKHSEKTFRKNIQKKHSEKTFRKNIQKKHSEKRSFGFKDVVVIIICISGAAFFLNLFRLDLFQTITSQDNQPVGTVTVRYNNIQRRLADRVLWSRLFVEAPVYRGDLIRVAENSAATLHISDNDIDLNENTLIRIQISTDIEDRVILDLGYGSLNLSNNRIGAGGIALNIMGSIITSDAGTVLSASAGEDGMTLQVNAGSLTITEQDGQSRSLDTGGFLALDASGIEQIIPAAILLHPMPNARFIANNNEPLNIRFAWNPVNLEEQLLRLEIAEDRSFARITQTIDNIDLTNAENAAALAAGRWYWRLSAQETVLSSGQLTIVNAAAISHISPLQDSLFLYQVSPPAIRFEWTPIDGASYYILEANSSPNFVNPLIRRESAAAALVEFDLAAGTWYWRIKPVFPSLFEGSADFSQVTSFRTERVDAADSFAAEVILPPEILIAAQLKPEPVPEPEPEIVVAPQPVIVPVQPLPQPIIRQPAPNRRIQFEELRATRQIDFSWSPVTGANAYILTIFQLRSDGSQRQIITTGPMQRTDWALRNLAIIDRGTFVWQVEAVSINRAGIIERRGRIAESRFIVDIPAPGLIEIEEIGVLYGR